MSESFIAHIRAQGYEFEKPFSGDTGTHWKRLRYNGEKKSSGRYRFIEESDFSIAIYGSDKDPLGFQTWKSWDKENLDQEEIQRRENWRLKKQKELEEQEREEQAKIAAEVNRKYKELPLAPSDHLYLIKKDIEPEKLKYIDEKKALIAPLYDPDNKMIASWQEIYPNGAKIFYKGGAIKGNYCPLKLPKESVKTVGIAEGYATAKKIREVMEIPMFVAYVASNLEHVAVKIKKIYPEAKIIIFADNDQFPSDSYPAHRKWVNTGIEKGKYAASLINSVMIYPEFKEEDFEGRPTDWQDFYELYGEDQMREEINKKLKPSQEVVKIEDKKQENAPQEKRLYDIAEQPFTTINQDNYNDFLKRKDNLPNGPMDKMYSLYNADIYLAYSKPWRGHFVYDEFAQCERIAKPMPWDLDKNFDYRDVMEVDKTQLRALLSTKNISISSNKEMGNIIEAVAKKRSVHPLREYFHRLEWDRVPRLDTWLRYYCGAEEQDADYLAAIGRCWMIAAVKRVFRPGTPFHHMLVLEGAQAAGKSSALRALGTINNKCFFTDNVGFDTLKDKHVAQLLKGRIIVEFAELSGLNMKDRNKIKSWITMEEDELMPKFSNDVVKLPRQFVLAGSTNDSNWLQDPTGGRRFWAVKVGKIKLEELKENVTQLWAEAVWRAKQGEMHYIPDNDPLYKKATAEQAARYDGHVWQDAIEDFLIPLEEVSIDDILLDCLHKPKERWTMTDKRDIGDILRGLNWEYKNVRCKNSGRIVKRWLKK